MRMRARLCPRSPANGRRKVDTMSARNNPLIGGTMRLVGDLLMLADLVRTDDGDLDLVDPSGVSFGRFSDALVLTEHRVGMAERRRVRAGKMTHGYVSSVPVSHLPANTRFMGLDEWIESRLTWITDDKQRDVHTALLAEIKAIMAQEQQG